MMLFAVTLFKNFFKNDVIGTAAQTAFYLILSIPPLMVLVISISINLDIAAVLPSFFELILPESVISVVNYASSTMHTSSQVTIISAIGVIFSASGSIWALMKGIHKAHTSEAMSFSIKNRVIAVFFTVIFIIVIAASLGSLVVSGFLSGIVNKFSDFETAPFSIIKRLIAAALIYLFIFLLYKYTPDLKLRGKDLFFGALFSAFGWIIVSMFFEKYVTYFTKYTTVYGGIGAFFILILWLFIISVVLLTGAQINASLIDVKQTKLHLNSL